MNSFVQLVYHPLTPEVIVPAFSQKELDDLEREGYKWVKLKRIGHIMRRGRKLSKAGMTEFLEHLEKYQIFISQNSLYAIERGEASFHVVTINFIQNLSRAFSMPVGDIVAPVKRGPGSSRSKTFHNVRRNRINSDSSSKFKTYTVTLNVGGEVFETVWMASGPMDLKSRIKEQFDAFTIVVYALAMPGLISIQHAADSLSPSVSSANAMATV